MAERFAALAGWGDHPGMRHRCGPRDRGRRRERGLNLDCAELLAALAICAAALLTLLAGSLGATAFRLDFFRLCVVAAGAGLGLPARLHGMEAPQNRAVP